MRTNFEVSNQTIENNIKGLLAQAEIRTSDIYVGEPSMAPAAHVRFIDAAATTNYKPQLTIYNYGPMSHYPEEFADVVGRMTRKMEKAGLAKTHGHVVVGHICTDNDPNRNDDSVAQHGCANYGLRKGKLVVTITLDETDSRTIHAKLKQMYMENEKEKRAEYGIESARALSAA